MLTRINNKQGLITYDKAVVEQIISEAFKPYKGSVWIANYKGPQNDIMLALGNYDALAEKEIHLGEHGVSVKVYLIIKIGSSISGICSDCALKIGNDIKNVLQLPLDNVELIVSAVVAKKASKRDIRFDYNSIVNGKK